MRVTIRDSGDLKAIARHLRQAADGAQLRRELTKGIRDELRPIAAQVKVAYRAGPSRSGTNRLRRALARSVRVEVRTSGRNAGARIRVDGRKVTGLGGRTGSLPRLYEGEDPWRVPVFGHRDVWVTRQPHPTFYPIVRPHEAQVRRRVVEICNDVLHRAQQGVR